MSALGQKRTCAVQEPMSALPPIATAKADSRKRACPLYPRKRTFGCSLSVTVNSVAGFIPINARCRNTVTQEKHGFANFKNTRCYDLWFENPATVFESFDSIFFLARPLILARTGATRVQRFAPLPT